MAKKKDDFVIMVDDNGKGIPLETQLSDTKCSNEDLRRKVAISIQEKVLLQTEISRLRVIIEKGGNNTSVLAFMTSMEREINSLKRQNSEYSDIGQEMSGLRSKVRSLESQKSSWEKQLKNEIETRDIQIDELTVKNKELQTELDIRVQEDSRFNNMDL